MITNQTIDGVQAEQMACMPVDRSYDVRAKMIIAFNEAKKAGGDLDDALDAAYKSALRYSPNPMSAEQPAPVAVGMPERPYASGKHQQGMTEYEIGLGHGACEMWDKIKELNPSRPTHANPPPGTEPSGTHHDNDGLDEWRKPK